MPFSQSIRSREPEPIAHSATGEGAADGYTFRAPRHGDLVVCPYCDADNPDPRFRCDYCGDEGAIFASEVFQ